MDYRDITSAIRDKDIPATYGEFTSSPGLPFVVVVESFGSDLHADNKNYVDIDNLQVELYTDKKHPPTEWKIEEALEELGLGYEWTETPIESESMFQRIYELQII